MASDSPHLKTTNFALCLYMHVLESRTWLELKPKQHLPFQKPQFLDNGHLGPSVCWLINVSLPCMRYYFHLDQYKYACVYEYFHMGLYDLWEGCSLHVYIQPADWRCCAVLGRGCGFGGGNCCCLALNRFTNMDLNNTNWIKHTWHLTVHIWRQLTLPCACICMSWNPGRGWIWSWSSTCWSRSHSSSTMVIWGHQSVDWSMQVFHVWEMTFMWMIN